MPVILERRTQAQAVAELSQLFSKHDIFCVRVTGAPGSGKTTLLDATLAAMPNVNHVAVLSLTKKPHQRDQRSGQSEYVSPEAGHEAEQILDAIEYWNLDNIDVLFIESDSVCTRSMGEHATVVLFSTEATEDLPLREPSSFLSADLCLMTKIDLLAETDFNVALASRNVARVRPGIQIMEVSNLTRDGLEPWMRWAESRKREVFEVFSLKPRRVSSTAMSR